MLSGCANPPNNPLLRRLESQELLASDWNTSKSRPRKYYRISEKGQDEVSKELKWRIEDLPEALPNDKGRIPLSDSIAELVLTVVFSIIAILLCSGILPIVFIIQNGDTEIRTLFSSSFLTSCILAIAIMALFDVCEYVSKIKARRWTPFVCGLVIVSNLINMGITIYLINRPDLFSVEFTSFLQDIDWGSFDILRFMGTGGINTIIIFISIITVVCSLIGCGNALYKTFKNRA